MAAAERKMQWLAFGTCAVLWLGACAGGDEPAKPRASAPGVSTAVPTGFVVPVPAPVENPQTERLPTHNPGGVYGTRGPRTTAPAPAATAPPEGDGCALGTNPTGGSAAWWFVALTLLALCLVTRRSRRALAALGAGAALLAAGLPARAQNAPSGSDRPQEQTKPRAQISDNSVDPFYGTFATSVDVVVPTYFGIEPKIRIAYSSADANGPLGVGWTLQGWPRIVRAGASRGAPRYDGSDIFLYGASELLPCSDHTDFSPSCDPEQPEAVRGTHSTKLESYQRFRYDEIADRWQVWSQDGTRSTFAPIHQVNAGGDTHTFQYGLVEVVDTHENAVSYEWDHDLFGDASAYPSSAVYADGKYRVDLYWQERLEPIDFSYTSTGAGFAIGKGRLGAVRVSVEEPGSGMQTVRVYALGYDEGGTTRRSKLVSLRQYGSDAEVAPDGTVTNAGQATSLPALTFGYLVSEPGFTTDGAWTTQHDNPFIEQQAQYFDVDGDGRGDRILSVGWGKWHSADHVTIDQVHEIRLANSSSAQPGWSPTADFTLAPELVAAFGAGYQIPQLMQAGTFAEINGDGKPDYLYFGNPYVGYYRHDHNSALGRSYRVFVNTGLGFSEDTSRWAFAGHAIATGYDVRERYAQYVDLDGDGLSDKLLSYHADGTSQNQAWLNRNESWQPAPEFAPPEVLSRGWSDGSTLDWRRAIVGDLNGDDLADLAYLFDDGVVSAGSVYLNSGRGFVRAPEWDIDALMAHYGWAAESRMDWVTPQDLDGDGIVELVASISYTGWSNFRAHDVWRFAAGGWVLDDTWSPPDVVLSDKVYGIPGPDGGEGAWYQSLASFVDLDGDGAGDLYYPTGGITEHGDGVVDGAALSNRRPELLVSMTNELGGTTTIDYTPSTAWDNRYGCNADGQPSVHSPAPHSCQGLPHVYWTVTSVTKDWGAAFSADGSPPQTSSTESFAYEGGLYDTVDKRFLGFRYVKHVLPQLDSESAPPYRETWFKQDYGSVSKPERIDTYSPEGVLLESVRRTYAVNGNLLPWRSQLSDEWTFSYDGSGALCSFGSIEEPEPCAHGRRTLVSYSYDAYANVTQKYHFGDVDLPDDEQVAVTSFVPNKEAYIVRLPATQVLRSAVEETFISETLYLYDDATHWNVAPVVGELTAEKVWLDTIGDYLTTTHSYTESGLRATSTEPTGAVVTRRYDPHLGLLEVERENAFGHVVRTEWSYRCQLAAAETDVNQRLTTHLYDALCRKTRTDSPDGHYERLEYLDLGQPGVQRVATFAAPPPDHTGELRTDSIMDGHGRELETIAGGRTPAENVHRRRIYDRRGGLAASSRPFFAADDGQEAYTLHTYDVLERRTGIFHPDGSSSSSVHTHDSVETTAEDGHITRETLDAHGRKIRYAEQTDGGGFAETLYGYDTRGDLVAVTDPAQNRWTMEYDSLGRRTRIDDPDAGTIVQTYDAAGKLLTQTSHGGSVVRFEYDLLGRKTLEVLDEGTESEVRYEWRYDERAGGGRANVGRMTTHLHPRGSREIDYDAVGNPVEERSTIDGRSYRRLSIYHPGGRLEQRSYPEADTSWTLHYAADGSLASIDGAIDALSYTAEGELRETVMANGTVTSYGYSNERGWLDSIATTSGSQPIHSLNIVERDARGRIHRVEGTDGTFEYDYDGQGRLVTASGPDYQQSFGYDATGNVTHNSALGNYEYGSHLQPSGCTGSECEATCQPDIDGNGLVDQGDLDAVLLAWGKGATGDTNGDGKTDQADLDCVLLSWGKPAPAESWSAACPSGEALPPMPHAVVSAGALKHCYDADGRMVASSAGRRVAYDANDRPVRVNDQLYAYDGEGERLLKHDTESGRTIHYPFGDEYEIDLGSGLTTLYWSLGDDALGAGPAFKRVGGAYFWHHLDHQGSVRKITDESGAVVQSRTYRAYGEILNEEPSVDPDFVGPMLLHHEALSFTGQRRDETGLFYLHARYYDPVLGRFLSPDPTVPTAGQVALNRYAYAYDDPVNKEDRSGLEPDAFGPGYQKIDLFGRYLSRRGYAFFTGAQGAKYLDALGHPDARGAVVPLSRPVEYGGKTYQGVVAFRNTDTLTVHHEMLHLRHPRNYSTLQAENFVHSRLFQNRRWDTGFYGQLAQRNQVAYIQWVRARALVNEIAGSPTVRAVKNAGAAVTGVAGLGTLGYHASIQIGGAAVLGPLSLALVGGGLFIGGAKALEESGGFKQYQYYVFAPGEMRGGSTIHCHGAYQQFLSPPAELSLTGPGDLRRLLLGDGDEGP